MTLGSNDLQKGMLKADAEYLKKKETVWNMEVYLSGVDRILVAIKDRKRPSPDGDVELEVTADGSIFLTDEDISAIIGGGEAPTIEVLKGTPSFIFKLQRLGKRAVISEDGERLLIVGKDSKLPESPVSPVRSEATKVVEDKVEPDFYAPPPIFDVVDEALSRKDVVFAFGMPGCGKDEMFRRIAKKHNWEAEHFELNGDMSKEDIFGFYEYKEGVGTTFTDGILPRCMRKGSFLVIDEMDYGPNEILMTMQKMLEKNPDNTFRTMYNPMNGEQVIAHADFRLAATANTCGKGDETALFPGTHPLNDAFLDRFPIVVRMEYPEKRVEAKILRKVTGIGEEMSTKIAELARCVREAFTNSKVYSTFSIRRSKNLAMSVKRGMKLSSALRITVLDRVSQEDAKAIIEIANRIWGSEVHS